MRLPSQKKILREDIKDPPSWINAVIDPVNSFMENVYQALNKNITFSDNVSSFIKELIYTTPSTYPSGVDTVDFLNALKTKAIGVLPLQVYDRATYTPPAGPVYVPWIENQGSIFIYPITGLAASKTYLIRFVVF